MLTIHDTSLDLAFATELEMQELEPMEAPGFWTGFGIGVGLVVSSVAAYSVVVATIAIT